MIFEVRVWTGGWVSRHQQLYTKARHIFRHIFWVVAVDPDSRLFRRGFIETSFFFCYQVVCMYLFKLSSSSSSPGARALRSTQGGIGRHFSFTTTLTITAILQKSTRITTIKLRFTRFCLKTFYTVTFMLLHTRRTESSARGQVRINTYTYWWEELLI